MPKERKLSESFVPASYELGLVGTATEATRGKLKITGKKIGRPAKRLTFHQKGLRVTAAQLVKIDKKGRHHIEIIRINHHKNFQEVRLHTENMLFPGTYEIELEFVSAKPLSKEVLQNLSSSKYELRKIFPSIDEPNIDADIKIA